MRRRVVLACAAGLLALAVLVLVFAAPTWSAPWFAADTARVAPSDWTGGRGERVVEGDAIRVTGEPGTGTAMLSSDGLALPAAAYRYLHYRADEIAPDMRLLLMWHSDGVMQRRVLPRVFDAGAIDLVAAKGWNGDVSMLALAAIPIDYLPSADVDEAAFRLERFELRSDNKTSALAALATDWLAPRPWVGVSINSGGSEFGVRGAPTTLFVACTVLLVLALVRAAGGPAALRRVAVPAIVVGVGVLVLDHTVDLVGRARAVTAAAAHAGDAAALSADPSLERDLAGLRAALPPDTRERVVVYAASGFARDYAVYLLRDLDAGALHDLRGFGTRSTLDGMLLVVVNDVPDTFDAAAGVVRLDDQARKATPLWDGERVRVFRLGAGAVTP